MGDIKKISETCEKDGGDWEEWPYLTVTIKSEVTGELRGKIIAKAGGEPTPGRVTLIETKVSAGYSEYTQEDECSIEVRIDGASVWKDEQNFSSDRGMAAFLRWVEA
jgi:hypothetical protein